MKLWHWLVGIAVLVIYAGSSIPADDDDFVGRLRGGGLL